MGYYIEFTAIPHKDAGELMEKRVSRRPLRPSSFTISIVAFLIALLAFLAAMFALRQAKVNMEQQELRILAFTTANKIGKVVTDRVWKAETLATLLVQGDGKIDDFDKIAAILVNDPSVLNVSLAPGGKVTEIFPLAGNERVLGLDYLASGGESEAKWARETGKLTLAGPFTMVQGGQTLTGRLPVFLRDGSFWGFVGIALAYPQVLDAAFLDELFQQGYSGEIWRIHPTEKTRQVIWRSSDFEHEKNVMVESREMNLFNVTWHISIFRDTDANITLEWWLFLMGTLFFSLLVAVLCYHYLELRHMKGVMENMAMTDPLTNLPNRRNMMEVLENSIKTSLRDGSTFVILYLDLNHFKTVNDTRGHDTGDMVLRKASGMLRDQIGNKGIIARVGGDKFIVYLPNFTRSDNLDRLVASLDDAMRITIPAELDKEAIEVSASFGVSYFPEDGKDLNTLLHASDLRMYNTKKIKNDTSVVTGFKSHFR